MAIYHFSVQVIGGAAGRSAVAAAAYRSASRLRDDRLGRDQDFSAKRGVVHSEVMLPENAPEEWRDREKLWNDVEAFEKRKDAQLGREVEFALPREMTERQGIKLARDFLAREFVDQGMIADLNVHWDVAEDGQPKPHAHVMLTMRSVGENGFGPKARGGTAPSWSSNGVSVGPIMSTSGWPNSTSTRGSTIAASRPRASALNRRPRSARPRSASRPPRARSASWDRSPGCFRRLSRTVAQTQCPLRD